MYLDKHQNFNEIFGPIGGGGGGGGVHACSCTYMCKGAVKMCKYKRGVVQ